MENLSSLTNQNSQPQPMHIWQGEAASINLLSQSEGASDKLKLLNPIFEKSAIALGESFSALNGSACKVNFLSSKLVSGQELLKQEIFPQYLAALWKNDQSMGGEGLFLLDRKLFYFFYNHLLGGLRPFDKVGQLSSLEIDYLKRLLSSIFEVVNHNFTKEIPFQFLVENLFLENAAMQNMYWNYDVIQTEMEVEQGENKYKLEWWTPKDILQLFKDLSSDKLAGQSDHKPEDGEWIDHALKIITLSPNLPINFQVRLSEIQMPLHEALSLQIGQTLPLEVSENGFSVFLDGKPSFLASMGVVGEKRAVQIN